MSDYFSDPSFMDAFAAYERLPLATRRALACTCKAQRNAQAWFFGRASAIRIDDEDDCTQANFDFLWCRLRFSNPQCALQVGDRCSLLPFAKMAVVGTPPPTVNASTVPYIAGFFLGRVLGRRKCGRIQVTSPLAIVTQHRVERILEAYDEVGYIPGGDPHRNGYKLFPSMRKGLPRGGWALFAGVYLSEAIRLATHGNPYQPYERLHLRHVHLDDEGAKCLLGFCDRTVQCLDLRSTIMPWSWGLFTMVVRGGFFSNLLHLKLSNNPSFATTGTQLLVSAIRANHLSKLHTLKLVETNFCDACMRMLVPCLGWQWGRLSLSKLCLGANPLTDAGLQVLMDVDDGRDLWNLVTLNLNPLGAITARQLVRLAGWIVREDGLRHLQRVVLFDPDDPMDPEDFIEPDTEYRDAHDAVKAAVKLRDAKNGWVGWEMMVESEAREAPAAPANK